VSGDASENTFASGGGRARAANAQSEARPLPLPLAARAPAKINLGLFLGPTREDGRHELITVMQPISLADELTLRDTPVGAWAGGGVGRMDAPGAKIAGERELDGERDVVFCPGVPGSPAENLAARALAAFRSATGWDAGPLELRIDKRVPVAAGLGGGSGDAAAALRLAAAASGLGEEGLLLEIARDLGADVPAQVRSGRWLASGAGERLQALPAPREFFGVLVLPGAAGLSTAAVYAQADRMGLARERADLAARHEALAGALAGGAALPATDLLANDLQDAARALCPAIDAALAQAFEAGADVALVSGSGPTVLGLFAGADGARRASEAVDALAAARRSAGAPAALAAKPVGERFAAVTRGAAGAEERAVRGQQAR
jgi:4-diphosphocytidyl-2-C-methyl-D-erythritol kinase